MRTVLALSVIAVGTQFCVPRDVSAHEPRRPRHLVGASVGLGLSAPAKAGSPNGRGFYGSAEYAYDLSAWFQPRAYMGLLLTFSDHSDCGDEAINGCEATAKIGFLGSKVRLAIPIPFIAPFFEIGLGASIGVIKTHTATVNEETTGVAVHIPFAIGLALGKDHNFEVIFRYLHHPAEQQVNGSVAIGLMFAVE